MSWSSHRQRIQPYGEQELDCTVLSCRRTLIQLRAPHLFTPPLLLDRSEHLLGCQGYSGTRNLSVIQSICQK
ncbi:hypothetical protein SKAU_G00149000 [Synaphobranchus kaupii]|uniref:Uncharacterized protein n=1 Tax=Synaphobranchus kaupii TaxID=118154 RepID=A0A9Q1FU51_SYNKA|nr:hypothetical protein SKAU_G00149000 [Synaphobranchus kaupii]